MRAPLAPVEALTREVARTRLPSAGQIYAQPLAEQLARLGELPVARAFGFEVAVLRQRIGDGDADLAREVVVAGAAEAKVGIAPPRGGPGGGRRARVPASAISDSMAWATSEDARR